MHPGGRRKQALLATRSSYNTQAVYLEAGLTSPSLIRGVGPRDCRSSKTPAIKPRCRNGTGARLAPPAYVPDDRQGQDHAPCVYHHCPYSESRGTPLRPPFETSGPNRPLPRRSGPMEKTLMTQRAPELRPWIAKPTRANRRAEPHGGGKSVDVNHKCKPHAPDPRRCRGTGKASLCSWTRRCSNPAVVGSRHCGCCFGGRCRLQRYCHPLSRSQIAAIHRSVERILEGFGRASARDVKSRWRINKIDRVDAPVCWSSAKENERPYNSSGPS